MKQKLPGESLNKQEKEKLNKINETLNYINVSEWGTTEKHKKRVTELKICYTRPLNKVKKYCEENKVA